MKLLLLVNGNARSIFSAQRLNESDFVVLKIDEKTLAKPKQILKSLRKEYDEVYFGCISIEFQRFIPFMLIYILLSKAKKGGIIDEEGTKVIFSITKTIFGTIPLLLVEFMGSIFIVIFSYLYYFIWRRFKVKN
ncbi:hypothetical protein D9V84_04270 [Bacteroidetes/Chlorobi group bacterium Naka2016]|jgi:hypothetical protein|nr:MAG: hypothetical protein D9V84_04270 [Bacteroidetes/Chlorobi group bacterium Naka2016]